MRCGDVSQETPVSAEPESRLDSQAIEQARQRLNTIMKEVAQLSESPLSANDFFAEFLQRVLTATAASGGAIWGKTPQGHLQLQYHCVLMANGGLRRAGRVNFPALNLQQNDAARGAHDSLLRQVVQQGRARLVPPHSSEAEDGHAGPAGNLTSFSLLFAPVIVDKQVAGLIEVWLEPTRTQAAQRGLLAFLTSMADLASAFVRNSRLRQMSGQQQLWTQLEAFGRQVHSSLSPREVAYLAANEGRRLIDCDRVSVAVRRGSATRVEAISGADVIEKRSSLVQTMRRLFDEVIRWGERVLYTGKKDEGLPPRVLKAMDAYLAESNSKTLLVLPLRDDREKDTTRPGRAGLMVEAFEPTTTPDALVGRAEVIARHVAPALYNAVEYSRLPLRWLLRPLANLKENLRGSRLAITGIVLGSLAILVAALVFIPYPLRMDAKGQVVPRERQIVYAHINGTIRNVVRNNGDDVRRGEALLYIEDREQQIKLRALELKRQSTAEDITELTKQLQHAKPDQHDQIAQRLAKAREENRQAQAEYEGLRKHLKDGMVPAPLAGKVVTFENERLLGRAVKVGDPLLQVAQTEGDWHIEIRIPVSQVGHVREALRQSHGRPLDVDLLLTSYPDRTYRGKLHADGLAGEVTVHNNEPGLLAKVQIDDIAREELVRMPVGAEVRAKVRCGNCSIGYVWFYELWEFLYEHLLF